MDGEVQGDVPDEVSPVRSKVSLTVLAERPRTRGDCREGPRPCPWVGCRYHLLLGDVRRNGDISWPHGGMFDPVDKLFNLEHSCALDVAEGGEQRGDRIASLLGVSPPLIRQVLKDAMAKLAQSGELSAARALDVGQ